MAANFETINRNKFIIAGAIAIAVGWGHNKFQLTHAVEKNKKQDSDIEVIRRNQNMHDMANVELKSEQKHLSESVNEIKSNQRKILEILRDVEKRIP